MATPAEMALEMTVRRIGLELIEIADQMRARRDGASIPETPWQARERQQEGAQ